MQWAIANHYLMCHYQYSQKHSHLSEFHLALDSGQSLGVALGVLVALFLGYFFLSLRKHGAHFAQVVRAEKMEFVSQDLDDLLGWTKEMMDLDPDQGFQRKWWDSYMVLYLRQTHCVKNDRWPTT